jgi:hypothetical protein
LRRVSRIVLIVVSVYTIVSEIVNQFTTLQGYVNGGYELDPTARYLLSTIGIVGETIAVFSIPTLTILVAYVAGIKWHPSSSGRNWVRRLIVGVCLVVLILLAISTTMAAASDFLTLHAGHLI